LHVDDADLLALDEGRHRHHDGEFLGIALVVVRHGDGGLAAVPAEHDLGRLVEELAVGLGDIEAAEGRRGRYGSAELSQDRDHGNAGLEAADSAWAHRVAPGLAGWIHWKRCAGKIRSSNGVSGESAISAT